MQQKRISLFIAITLAVCWGWVFAVSRTAAQSNPQETAVTWLLSTHQNNDGGFTSFSGGANLAPSDISGAVDALQALAAAGADTSKLLAYLESQGTDLLTYAQADGGSAGKLLLALTAAGVDPGSFAGQDLTQALVNALSSDGRYNTSGPYAQAVAILGLAAAEKEIAATAVSWLQSLQASNGSWDDGFGTSDNVDATAMAVMALVAAGVPGSDPSLANAAVFLRQAEQARGWEYAPGFGPNANSTALAIQALSALGDDATSRLGKLLAWQGDSGAFQADFGTGPFDDFFTTVQALPALGGKPFPLNLAQNTPGASSPEMDMPTAVSLLNTIALILAAVVLLAAIGWAIARRRA